MKKQISVICCIGLISACNSDKIQSNPSNIKLNEGLVVNIPFNNSTLENVSQTQGVNFKGNFCNNRKQIPNQAMHFNRNDSSIIDFGDLTLASFESSVFSISCWVLLEDTVKPCAILSKRSAFGGFEYSLDNHFRDKQFFNLDNWIAAGTNTVYGVDPLNASVTIDLNKWQHILFIANGNKLLVYKNGELQSNFDAKNNESFSNTDKHFVIGNGGGYGKNYYFQGAIDDVKIYNRVLNNEEINALFNE